MDNNHQLYAKKLVRCLVWTTVVNTLAGFGCCVVGGMRWDRRTQLAFKHAGAGDGSNAFTTYDSDISLAFTLAAINLLTIVWPVACLGDKWWTTKKNDRKKPWNLFFNNVVTVGVNPFRWFEFVLSVPLAVLVCAIGLGANDFLFLLSQMTLTVALVIVTYGQEREKMLPKANRTMPWFPLSTAVGLFTCQWALIFWTAYEAREFATDTANWGWAPTVCFFGGNGAILYMVARRSAQPKFVGDEIITQIISCVTRLLLTFSTFGMFIEL